MPILDQFGNATRPLRFAHAASRNPYRGPVTFDRHAGVDKLIPMQDRRTLSALSRRLVFNQGPAKEAIRQKASYSVGCAWMPVYSGSDAEVGSEAVSWLTNVWYPLCDVRGGGHDWHELLELASKSMDREGEAFILLTKSADDFPQLQHVPSYMVWSKAAETVVEKGAFKGLKIEDGVIADNRGRPVAFRINKDEQGEEFEDVSARDIIHVFDSDFPEQKRGYPAFAHALDDMQLSMSSKDLEAIRQNIISSIYLIETTEDGVDPEDPAWTADIDTTNLEATLRENLAPGIRHIKGGEKLEVLKHENPGDVWEAFQDRLLRSAIVGMGWSYSMVWKSPGQGTAERADVVRARRAVESRQKKLRYVAKRAITWALAVADAVPRLTVRAPGNMLKWSFNLPERLTVDDGREARALQEGVNNGTISESEFQAFKGKSYEQHVREQAQDKITRAKVAREMSINPEGVTISPEELGAKVDNINETPQAATEGDDE